MLKGNFGNLTADPLDHGRLLDIVGCEYLRNVIPNRPLIATLSTLYFVSFLTASAPSSEVPLVHVVPSRALFYVCYRPPPEPSLPAVGVNPLEQVSQYLVFALLLFGSKHQ
jgi:hypothetical protein